MNSQRYSYGIGIKYVGAVSYKTLVKLDLTLPYGSNPRVGLVSWPLGAEVLDQVLNFGPYQYLLTGSAIVGNTISKIIVINKVTFAVVEDAGTIPGVWQQGSFIGLLPVEDKYYLAFVRNRADTLANKNFNSYYINGDGYCDVRDPVTSICTQCAQGYYKIGTAAAGDMCVSRDNLPTRTGIIPGSNGLVALCADLNCLACRDNYQVCTECDTGSGYILSSNKCVFDTQGSSGTGQPSRVNVTLQCAEVGTLRDERAAFAVRLQLSDGQIGLKSMQTIADRIISDQEVGWVPSSVLAEGAIGRVWVPSSSTDIVVNAQWQLGRLSQESEVQMVVKSERKKVVEAEGMVYLVSIYSCTD